MEDTEYLYIQREVKRLVRVDLDHYKRPQVQRRLDTLLARSGYPTWQAYFAYLRTNQEAMQGFRDYLTINVTEFFRDPQKWQYLEQNILPELLRQRQRLRIWSAGCSHGAEPYTLAILLDELGGGARHHILATDIHRAVLAKAQQGGPYLANEVRAVTPARLARYFVAHGESYTIRPELRSRATFRAHNLLLDDFDEDFDLIVCRNVVIYFVEESKRALYQRFAQALRPGGVLFVGGTELVPALPNLPLSNVAVSFYRRRELSPS
ncbi:MAG TPA: protein-glutamate O-methyltransferase CheR [Chloroflexi bacterium]|jgi:chemotaxis protein methyltransferase CheR|nr:protein-glutamate O-methyltransferase CheR [Chloroflexota bacterium]